MCFSSERPIIFCRPGCRWRIAPHHPARAWRARRVGDLLSEGRGPFKDKNRGQEEGRDPKKKNEEDSGPVPVL